MREKWLSLNLKNLSLYLKVNCSNRKHLMHRLKRRDISKISSMSSTAQFKYICKFLVLLYYWIKVTVLENIFYLKKTCACCLQNRCRHESLWKSHEKLRSFCHCLKLIRFSYWPFVAILPCFLQKGGEREILLKEHCHFERT